MTRFDIMDYFHNSERQEWYICRDCIDAIRSRGEKLFIGDCVIDGEFAEECGDCRCEFCGEYADLYECL